MKTVVLADADAVAARAARFVAEEARRASAERGRFSIAVSGGRTPWGMLRALADQDIAWDQVEIFQTDERVAPAGDQDRNIGGLHESLGGMGRGNIHPMPVEEPDLEVAAARYADTLRRHCGRPPVLDLVHLGLGADGHTASLVPGDPVLEVSEVEVAVTGTYLGRCRMSLTYPLLNRARKILWLVVGGDKAAMLARLQAGDTAIPAGRVRASNAVIFADRAAGAGR